MNEKKKSTQPPWWYRRNYCISPRVQLKIVGLLAGVALIAAVLICTIAYRRLLDLGVLFNASLVVPAMRQNTFENIAHNLMIQLIVIVGVMILVFAWLGILLTHRVAGPIWKLEHDLAKFLNGEAIQRPLRFRRNDEFHSLPTLINKLLDGYKKH